MKTKTTSYAEYYIFVIALLILSLVYSTASVEPVLTIRLLILGLVLFVINSYVLKNKTFYDLSILKNPIFLFYGLYVVFSAISMTQVINLSEGIFELIKILLFGIYLVTITLLLERFWDKIDVLIKSIIVLQLIIAVIALVQFYTDWLGFIPGSDRVYATMTNRNLLSSALFLMLPFSIYGFLKFKKVWLIFVPATIVLSGIVIIITRTRSVWLALVVGCIGILIIMLANKKLIFKDFISVKKFIQLVLIAVIVLIIGFASSTLIELDESPSESSKKYVRQTSVQKKKLTSAQTLKVRFVAWEKTTQMITDNPAFGVGPGNWKLRFPEYGLKKTFAERGRYHYKRPHNDFLWTAAEIGIPGALAYLIFLLLPLIIGIRSVTKISDKQSKRMMLCLLMGYIGYLVISYFSFPKERIVHSVFLFIIIAIILVLDFKSRKNNKKPFKYPVIVNILLLFPIIVVGYLRYESEVHLKKALTANNGRVALEEIAKVNNIFYTIDPAVTPVAWHKGVMYSRGNQNRDAFASFLQAEKVHPNHVYVLLNLGDVYRFYGKNEKAIDYYRKALQISPRFEDALINMSIAYYNQGDYDKAHKVLNRVGSKTKNKRYEEYMKLLQGKLNEIR